MTALSVLSRMCERADRVHPWKADEFVGLCGSQSSAYRALRRLSDASLVKRVRGGWTLSPLVLSAGAKSSMAFAKIDITREQEKVYGKAAK